jgi:hypothetical protein
MARSVGVGLCLSLVAALAVACSGGGATGPAAPTTPDGNYTLSTVAGKTLPYVMFSDTGYTVTVTGGTLSLTTARRYDIATNTSETFAGSTTPYVDRSNGSWTTTNGSSSVTLTPNFGATIAATWTGSKLSLTMPEGVYLYVRTP